jgi:hypothetical protein
MFDQAVLSMNKLLWGTLWAQCAGADVFCHALIGSQVQQR